MFIFCIAFGLLFIALGFLAKYEPRLLIFGIDMKADHVDLPALSSFCSKGLFITGSIIIAGFLLFTAMGWPLLAEATIIATPLIGSVIMINRSRKYYRTRRNRRLFIAYSITGTIVFLVLGIFSAGYIPTHISVKENFVDFDGMYGYDIQAHNISDVQIADSIPPTLIRMNGFNFAGTQKGYFTLDEWGPAKLFIYAGYNGPYIVITDDSGFRTVFNTKDRGTAEMFYDRIRSMIPPSGE